jgi:hypothetical protein
VNRLAGLVAGQVTLAVALDHVRTRGDDVLVVRRRALLVVLLRELLRDRRRDRHDQERGEARRLSLRELERELVRVVDDDARDVLERAGLLRVALDEVEVRRVLVRDVLRRRTLERVLDVLRLDLAVDRRAELDALLQLHRHGLLVIRDLGLAVGKTRHSLSLARLGHVQRGHRGVEHLITARVVRLAGVEEVDVGSTELLELAALLAGRGRAVARLAGAATVTVTAAAGDDEDGEGDQRQSGEEP